MKIEGGNENVVKLAQGSEKKPIKIGTADAELIEAERIVKVAEQKEEDYRPQYAEFDGFLHEIMPVKLRHFKEFMEIAGKFQAITDPIERLTVGLKLMPIVLPTINLDEFEAKMDIIPGVEFLVRIVGIAMARINIPKNAAAPEVKPAEKTAEEASA